MQEKRKDPEFRTNDKDPNTDTNTNGEERPLSDSQKIVRRHLENENDIITDEDIAGVRIGMTPADLDDATEARFEGEDAIEKEEEEILGDIDDIEEGEVTERKKITPWDTIDPA
jgi:hypothetical protein